MYEYTIKRTNERGVKETRSGCSNRKTIKNIEKNISGENNKIINYQIDYEKTHQNAGGGIEVEVFINGNRDFRISLLVDKSQNKYSVGTSVVSKELANFLEQ